MRIWIWPILALALGATGVRAQQASSELAALLQALERELAAGRALSHYRVPFANRYVIRRCNSDAAPARERLAALAPRIARRPAAERDALEALRERVGGCLECRFEATELCERAGEGLAALRALQSVSAW